MKIVILAGGRGTRISEESHTKPKPMVEIGEAPILWHIMKTYSHFGFNEFIICLGYKGNIIKEYFSNYYRYTSDIITYDFTSDNLMEIHHSRVEPWRVTLVDTGINTMTGGRIKRIEPLIGNEPFMLTYGDGVADIDIGQLLSFHQESGRLATITGVQPDGRFGGLELDGSRIRGFTEKVRGDGGWVNGGYMVMEPSVFNYIPNDDTCILEQAPLQQLASDSQLSVYRHSGFWHPMDTLRDKMILEELWNTSKAPWKVWDEKEST